MKKSLLFVLISLFMLSSCGNKSTEESSDDTPTDQHVHTYSEFYSCDENEHWREATCEHKDLVVDKAEHQFNGWKTVKRPSIKTKGLEKRTCEVCDYIAYKESEKPVVFQLVNDLEDPKETSYTFDGRLLGEGEIKVGTSYYFIDDDATYKDIELTSIKYQGEELESVDYETVQDNLVNVTITYSEGLINKEKLTYVGSYFTDYTKQVLLEGQILNEYEEEPKFSQGFEAVYDYLPTNTDDIDPDGLMSSVMTGYEDLGLIPLYLSPEYNDSGDWYTTVAVLELTSLGGIIHPGDKVKTTIRFDMIEGHFYICSDLTFTVYSGSNVIGYVTIA